MFGVPMAPVPVVDSWVKEGDTCTFDALKFKVLHMPGHSPGSVVYQFEEPEALLVAGDLLFAGSIGRMDLPGGNEEQMKKSLERVLTLPDSLVVIPGHGPKTTIGKEKRQNPYLVGGMAGW
jgi:glyoxylase-like metal-dependent hydrolase (beta-lactamase superfamily II)